MILALAQLARHGVGVLVGGLDVGWRMREFPEDHAQDEFVYEEVRLAYPVAVRFAVCENLLFIRELSVEAARLCDVRAPAVPDRLAIDGRPLVVPVLAKCPEGRIMLFDLSAYHRQQFTANPWHGLCDGV